jgi:hypothetical protein
VKWVQVRERGKGGQLGAGEEQQLGQQLQEQQQGRERGGSQGSRGGHNISRATQAAWAAVQQQEHLVVCQGKARGGALLQGTVSSVAGSTKRGGSAKQATPPCACVLPEHTYPSLALPLPCPALPSPSLLLCTSPGLCCCGGQHVHFPPGGCGRPRHPGARAGEGQCF